jgi:monooxygenase
MKTHSPPLNSSSLQPFDVVIVGAGISGIDAAYRLQTECPAKSYAVLEARSALGGTWDLFRYPGVRSDSDMHTLGFPFHPWHGKESIASGDAIRNYVGDTARHFGIDRRIKFGHRLVRASWVGADARWNLDVQVPGSESPLRFSCRFLLMCSGYYDYAGGYSPKFAGTSKFGGQLLHPQDWPDTLDYAGKRIVVIGSGATAVTLVPALAAKAAHVTLLQRSPTYVVTRAAQDPLSLWLYRYVPARLASKLTRWKNILYGNFTFYLARRRPSLMKRILLKGVRRELPDYDVDSHFTPRYDPWDQRICLVPDGDLFAAIRTGKASVVTDVIDSFMETGIRLISGETLPADIVVSATGLVVKLMGGAEILVDGVPVQFNEKLVYKGCMFNGVPNLAMFFGYTNASWTLRCDLTARFVCRVLRYMDRKGWTVCMPDSADASVVPEPLLDFSSGYVTRGNAVLPRRGQKPPWRVKQNYLLDLAAFAVGSIDDGTLKFRRHG